MTELLQEWKRSALCAAFTKEDIGKDVTLMGWADSRRDLGALIFVYLRDRSGMMQIVFNEADLSKERYEKASSIRNEFVLAVKGKIAARTPENINPDVTTGELEVLVSELKILNGAETPPFVVADGASVREELRLKYRYLDLRRADMQRNLMLRNQIANTARGYLVEQGFMDIETPMLQISTPEGARDYLVPSRIHAGSFYALPQSPQLFKQILMVSGFDRYFQITKCFRDEDLRADRQPEFTQIDTEMSFVDTDDVMRVHEGMMQRVFQEVMGIEMQLPIKRLTYAEAMDRFGSDKPDTRFGLELTNVSDALSGTEFKVFAGAIAAGGSVRGINAKGAALKLSRKEVDALGEYVKTYGAKGLAWAALKPEGMTSSFAKFLKEEEMNALIAAMDAQEGDLLLFVADKNDVVYDALGALRLHLAHKLDLIPENTWDLLWVTEFPLLEYNEEAGRYVAKHHPFTSPMDEDLDMLETDPARVRAKAYDIVLNGNEIGGGSIRIHSAELQVRMFRALGFTMEEAWNRFGFLLEAFRYGTPPHGGLAYGLDRMAMLMAGASSIRDVIAFPKVQNASCLMTNAPSEVEEKQLAELHVRVVKE